MLNGSSSKNRRMGRLVIFQVLIIVTFLVLVGRIYQIQFLERDIYVAQARENRLDTVCTPATRGIIVDRNERPLAVNVASANVVVVPALLPDDEAETLRQMEHLAGLINIPLSGILNTRDERGIPQQSLMTMIETGEGIAPYRGVVVKTDIDYETARIIMAEQQQGVSIDWVSARDYPTGALTAHLIGYMGPISERFADEYEANCYVLDRDRIGYDGVEFTLDEYLSGIPGRQRVVRDVAGQVVTTLSQEPPTPGYNIQLTIDADLQARAQKHLVDTLDNLREADPTNAIGFDRGVVIAMNPQTGEILAMVSWPTYDNQRFARSIDYPYYQQVSQDPKHPLFNQAISSLYPPGSIFKILTATAVLEENIVEADYEVLDPGSIQLQNRYYPNEPARSQNFVCWIEQYPNLHEHGMVNMIEGIAWSCDVYFYKVGGGYTNPDNGAVEVEGFGLGIGRLGNWMELYGLGEPTGVELAGEIGGTIPSESWKRRTWGENWSTGDTYNTVFGQGYVLTTPLQMINVLNTVANNGIMTRPTLVREIRDADGRVVQNFQPDTTDFRDLLREFWPKEHSTNPDLYPDGDPYPETLDETLAIVQEGMRQAAIMNIDEIQQGTAITHQERLPYVPVAGKTGTAEFCDNIAAALNRCDPGNWPAHAWYMGYAPYGNPEISVIAFVYNGKEGAGAALPIVAAVMDDYFTLKTQRALEAQMDATQPVQPSAPAPTPTVEP